ncbi:MAG: AMP-binding protein [Xanthobacteraceae bacterium]|jgi:acyl-CoA synthetase (AMP-forming)/AMP-acid ligase II
MNPDWQNLTDPFFHWAAQRPDAVALRQGPETLSYRELAVLVGKAAVHLDGIGIRQGDCVAINLTNSIDHLILTLGLLRLGATTMEIPYNVQRPPHAGLLAQFAVRTVFIEPMGAPVEGAAAIKVDANWRGLIGRAQGDRRSGDDGGGIFTVSLSSGTTGQPTGALVSHREYFQRINTGMAMYADTDVFSSERPPNLLLVGGIAFSFYFWHMAIQLCIGGSITILPDFLHTVDLVKAIGAWDDAVCDVTSPMCRVLLSCAPQEGLLYPRLRALLAGGGFVYPQEKLAMLARVTPNFYEIYGVAGFGPVATLSPAELHDHADSVGRPPPVIEVQVVDDDGRPLPTGRAGRLRLRYRPIEGERIAVGADPAGAEGWRDGWYYPGDSAHLDAAGYIHIRGRPVEIIERNGVEFYAADIEAVIAQHPSVSEVAVVGVPRPLPGDEIVALVVPRGPSQHEALAQHCKNRLPAERWPDRVFYTGALPKTASGKLDRTEVKAMVMAEIARRAGQ